MAEQKLFGKTKETNCDIMFLVSDGVMMRLMSFKTNPWLKLNGCVNRKDPEICDMDLYMFEGSLNLVPGMEEFEDDTEKRSENSKKWSRKFSYDKI